MISLAPSVLLIATALSGAAEPASTGLQFELTTLSGHRQTGVLTELSSDSATLTAAGKTVKVPLAEVLDIRALSVKADRERRRSARPELALTDGSHLFFSGLRVSEAEPRSRRPTSANSPCRSMPSGQHSPRAE